MSSRAGPRTMHSARAGRGGRRCAAAGARCTRRGPRRCGRSPPPCPAAPRASGGRSPRRRARRGGASTRARRARRGPRRARRARGAARRPARPGRAAARRREPSETRRDEEHDVARRVPGRPERVAVQLGGDVQEHDRGHPRGEAAARPTATAARAIGSDVEDAARVGGPRARRRARRRGPRRRAAPSRRSPRRGAGARRVERRDEAPERALGAPTGRADSGRTRSCMAVPAMIGARPSATHTPNRGTRGPGAQPRAGTASSSAARRRGERRRRAQHEPRSRPASPFPPSARARRSPDARSG